MNQERQEAYLNLIQQLLDCPSGKEPEILAANQELLLPSRSKIEYNERKIK